MNDSGCRAAILISGSGSNLQAFIDRRAEGRLALDIAAVVSNERDAYGLERAAAAGIPGYCIDHRRFGGREPFDRAVASVLDREEIELVILAGFMRILSDWFVEHFHGRILNIHPALLPKYPGLDTHRRVLAAGDALHGSTVHFVSRVLDGGPRVLQGRLPIRPDDTPESLKARVQSVEHAIYPRAAQWFAEGRLECREDAAWLDGKRLEAPIVMDFDPAP